MDKSSCQLRKQRELYWILKLRTAYPYGLNDRIGDEFKKDVQEQPMGLRFPSLARNFVRLSRGSARKGTPNLTPEDFINNLNDKLKNNISSVANFIRLSLSSMRKSYLKVVYDCLETDLNNQSSDFPYTQYLLLALDFIETKIYRSPIPSTNKSFPKNICKIKYVNKGIEFINLPRILNDSKLQNYLPSTPVKFEAPMITYKLEPSIACKIFNFNKFVAELDLKAFIENPEILPCDCLDSEFTDKHHKHIVTGDLKIIPNNNLRKILVRGPKFRSTKPINFNDARDSILTGVSDCIKCWCLKNAIPYITFSEYLQKVKESVDSKIVSFSKNINIHMVNAGLNDTSVSNSLKLLQDKFVITPIDKATGNIAIICKRHYANVLVKELQFDNTETNLDQTYTRIYDSSVSISNTILKDIKRMFNLDNTPVENHCLPKMYWIPKMHKNPSKSRFIVAAPKCSIKPLSKAITSAFKLFYRQIESYNNKCRFFSGINTFWVIQNSRQVTEAIKKINKRGYARSVNTFDFSTLYTKIPHDKLIFVLHSIVDFCFKGGECKYIAVTKQGARWVRDATGYEVYFDKETIKQAIVYLLNSCYFTVGIDVLRQIIGIPMGSDPAPFFANFFLYFFEREWLLKLKRRDIVQARKFGNCFRFIDDLNILNDCGEFSQYISEIYPKELTLNKENECDQRASFLDLFISVENHKFSFSLYDKRDDFQFSIVRMPHSISNIPSSIFYSSVGAEVLRIARANSNVDSFLKSTKVIISRMLRQGANVDKLKSVIGRFFGRHLKDFNHIAPDSGLFVNMVLT